MKRRLLLRATAACPLASFAQEEAPRPLHKAVQDEAPRPRHKVSAQELHKVLSTRFPRRFGVAGLLELEVSAPRLILLPARNMLGASLVAQASGTAAQPLPPGEVDLVFRLRYEPVDQTVRAQQPDILELRLPGAHPETTRALQRLLPALARDLLGEFVLHRFSPRELALADTMGFEPEKLTVVEDGLLVEFGRKRSP